MEFLVAKKTFHILMKKNKNDQTIRAIQIHSTLLYSNQKLTYVKPNYYC